MTMIWLILRYQDDVGLWDVREVGDTRGDGVFREQEFGMPH